MSASIVRAEEAIRSYWNKRQIEHTKGTVRYWYQHPQTLRHYRDQVVLSDKPLQYKPIYCFLDNFYGRGQIDKAVSIGCGSGHKEITLVEDNIVNRFDLFELSDSVIEQGQKEAARKGVCDRVSFRRENVFNTIGDQGKYFEKYDLVHWDNSLHHMFDVADAIQWSVNALRKGGMLVIDDYMGPSYMQVGEKERSFADAVRSNLPEKYLINPADGEVSLKSPNIPKQRFLDTDPSEMADSGNILGALKQTCTGVNIKLGGGVLFFLGLRPLFGNFDPGLGEDARLLGELLEMDKQYTRVFKSSFHNFAFWEKP